MRGWFASCFSGSAKVDTESSIKVFYGSESGTTKNLALRLRQLGAQRSVSIVVAGLETFEPTALASNGKIIFLTASYGTGGPTTNAADFHKWLAATDTLLPPFEFCVFGVGSSIYADSFNGMGKYVHARLTKRGGRAFYPLGLGDSLVDLDHDFLLWETGLWAALQAPREAHSPKADCERERHLW
ncbi:NADPH--cytochrome P450 reductase-like isoform 1 [Achlya hypogyna]|uniref:NADPH--cytochrome P450 reductase-like isoform 1 n=1 Tax=Achlya hypogyna TaxID=1202772 RepID=A0A1V9YLN2_ACHHY|nr:NADPH--cytochrome P450 reductase-like isoform 1 [Achlya hypogyna]